MTLPKTIFLTLAVAGFTGCQAQLPNEQQAVENVSAVEFKEKLTHGTGVLVDVRTPDEFAKGHIESARLMDFYSDDFKDQVLTLDSADTVFVYCRSGNRSSQAVEIMRASGITQIVHLAGGINSWNKAGLPLAK